ncbi:PREDICTED: SUMO-specific isopeptidase USPL1 [Cyprinodon variegatus]|uniref:Ubiquitin specific peptidase like 1 n=1 Tax=Cyprinodon variegatus TaxID=28743 RepID=A0A3Q2E5C5_CYPVA|nr:PREDICTED: SUMO-specific isopeptidase USPL1 [Cyprinodon variegatus]
MVIYIDRQKAAMEPRSDSCLPMTGEGTGLEALASPQAGYLGKVQERAASLQYCPWCASKGLNYPLRSYRINLQESITLCTNPQCLFPLVTRPLEDVLASLKRVESTAGVKRKNVLALDEEDAICPIKRQRPVEDGELLPQSVPHSCSLKPATNGESGNPNRDIKKVDGSNKETPDAEHRSDPAPPACSASPGHSSEVLLTSSEAEPPASFVHLVSPDVIKQKNDQTSNRCNRLYSSEAVQSVNVKTPSALSNEETTPSEKQSLMENIPPGQDVNGFHPESQDLSENLVSVPKQLLWRNSHSLCWLDSLLAVLVNCKSLRKLGAKDEPQSSSVWRLLKEYEEICAAVQEHQQTSTDGVVRVPNHVLQNAHVRLESLRMSVFELLQPKLHCKLGQKETPVFALPLLLSLDSWMERLFQTTYTWEFKCSKCKVNTKERVVKTLPTFTNIVPGWTPLNAAHLAPCNNCCKKNQKRKMLLESLPPVFALHFVEGLPDSDIRKYTFSFKGKCYFVSTVIQYNHQLKHFVTWINNEDGSWLEYDDLKHPACETHQQLQIPAQEIHVVFWEVEGDPSLSACAPSPAENKRVSRLKGLKKEVQTAQTPDQSFVASHNDTDIVCALSGDDGTNDSDTTGKADVDTSIGASTLLDAFEGLSHNDIITLTMVEIQPSKDVHQTEELSSPVGNEASLPDSSIPAAGEGLHQVAQAEPKSDSESGGAPTFEPKTKHGQGRGANTRKSTRLRGKKADPSKDAPPPAAPEPLQPVSPAQIDTHPATEPTSTVSSTNKSPPSSALSSQFSFLLSRYQQHRKLPDPPPNQNHVATEVKPSHPVHSTPNPVKKLQIPPGVPKTTFITEEVKCLPPKAAEMYGGFGAKNPSPAPSPLSIPPLLPAAHPNQPASLTWKPPPLHLEISSLKKPSSSKVPLALNSTEALRYKLLKKLKAKKKKLAKLNHLLENGGMTHLRPDSTDLGSPSTVTSSTFDGSTCDDILSDLLSPATTASHLSPDSTGFLEMVANGTEGPNQLECLVNGSGVTSQAVCHRNQQEDHNFLEDFLSQF